MSRPFPPDCSSIDEIIRFGKRHNVQGFNRECIRSYIYWRLHQHFQCTSFVETGTLYGQTSAFVRRAFDSPVFTSEINPTFHLVSRANLLWLNRIKQYRSNSIDFLKDVCREPLIGANPMFYLDAHWYEYLPLQDELAIIGERCQKAIILIDDFLVPHQPGFLYDEYPGARIDLDLIMPAMKPRENEYSVYLPDYKPDLDPRGRGTGYAVLLLGQEKDPPDDAFPFDFLRRVPGLESPAEARGGK